MVFSEIRVKNICILLYRKVHLLVAFYVYTSIHTHTHTHVCVCIYNSIKKQEEKNYFFISKGAFVCGILCIYIYIYKIQSKKQEERNYFLYRKVRLLVAFCVYTHTHTHTYIYIYIYIYNSIKKQKERNVKIVRRFCL